MPNSVPHSLPFSDTDIMDHTVSHHTQQQHWKMKNRGSGFEQQPGQVQQVYNDAAGKTASGQRSVLAGYNPYSAVEHEHYYTADQYQQYNFQCAAKYFIMKCGNQRNIDESVQTGFWQTSVASEKKLQQAASVSKNVYLIFSVQTSGHFQGYARIVGLQPALGSNPNCSSTSGTVIRVEWLKRANLPFQRCHHLYNPWNENRKVQIARDGQELEPSVGEGLVRLWDDLPTLTSYRAATNYYTRI